MEAEFHIKGAEVLFKALRKMNENAEREVGFAAINAGARELIKIARANAPKKTGKLRRSFGTRKNKKRINEITMTIGIKKGKQYAYYAHLIEFGTSAHYVGIKNKKTLSGGDVAYGAIAKIPAIAAQPFFGPALEEGAPRILDAMKYRLATDLIKRGAL